MCTFCAAIPMSVTLGIAVAGKQKEKHAEAQARGEPVPYRKFPVGKATFALTSGLVVCSAVYHLLIMPRTGAFI